MPICFKITLVLILLTQFLSVFHQNDCFSYSVNLCYLLFMFLSSNYELSFDLACCQKVFWCAFLAIFVLCNSTATEILLHSVISFTLDRILFGKSCLNITFDKALHESHGLKTFRSQILHSLICCRNFSVTRIARSLNHELFTSILNLKNIFYKVVFYSK